MQKKINIFYLMQISLQSRSAYTSFRVRAMDIFRTWREIRKSDTLEEAQDLLVSHSLENSEFHPYRKPITVSEGTLNTVVIEKNEPTEPKNTLLMVHGYGAGLGVFYRNFPELAAAANKHDSRIVAMDLLGHGLSSSPGLGKFDSGFKSPKVQLNEISKSADAGKNDSKTSETQGTKLKVQSSNFSEPEKQFTVSFTQTGKELSEICDKTEKVIEQCESYYVDSIEHWRKSQKLEKFSLLGHSFGAYLSMCYALKYPDRVENLILVSPVGVERSIFSLKSIRKHVSENNLKDFPLSTDPANVDYSSRLLWVPSFLMKMWDSAILPFPFLRSMGPVGVYVANKFTSRRYVEGSTDSNGLAYLSNYVLATFWRKSSTEKAIVRLMSPIISARDPIFDKLEDFGAKQKDEKVGKFPRSFFVYGDKDWMDVTAGKIASDYINSRIKGGPSKFRVVVNSGHNVFLDNPPAFNEQLIKFMRWG